ncbi:MAG: LysR family transcriptional regulator [Bacilli bacterium]|jgi:DNA-binding transcriptional LysR family regulator|nr:LysR family transcriptional regulator [Bacilli bacterium]
MINLELYKVFYAVAETGNITKASEQLHISQPAITKQIKNLENELGTPLFIRTNKGVKLNDCGEKILLNVKQGLTLLNEIEYMTTDYNNCNTGTIKIGTSTSLMKNYLLKHLEKFHHNYPNIILDIYTDPTKDLIKKLKNGNIDMIISKLPHNLDNDLSYKELGQTKYIFSANPNYFDLKNKTLKPSDLEKLPIILQENPANSRTSVENYFLNNNIIITPKMNIASSNLLIDFIKMGYGIGYVTELFIKEELNNNELIEINLNPQPEKISFGLIVLKNSLLSSCCSKFINSLKKYR